MLLYPHINPIAVELGPLKIHWYGIMYLVGFAGAWFLCDRRAHKRGWKKEQVSDLIFYGALGVVLGGRIGHVVFYNFESFLQHPLSIFKVWEGGMSFHGGMLGVFVALYLYGRKIGKHFFEISDFIAPVVPIGLGAGRIGNFIGGELWGRATDVPWAMVFPRADALARHPSQLYQCFLEGVVMFTVLYVFSQKPRPLMSISGLFLILYGTFRIMVEFVREPDSHLGFIAFNWLTMGQLLSLPMVIMGILFFVYAYRVNGDKFAQINR
jgi:phosphatidylglycerol---prolipoprotein diacylglyceryl transferase